ncbi:MAG: CAP domain-containing protein [Myxococcaceae bacterium]|nr:CAP domain-containing protein [Myxococcaceae bacterium]
MRAAPTFSLICLAACSSPMAPDAGVDAGRPGCFDVVTGREALVCQRWECDRNNLDEGSWSGSTSACTPGDLSLDSREAALRLINLYRFLADLPAVETSAQRDAAAQACALMMHATGRLDHQPDSGFACYTPMGAQAAGNSNLSLTPAIEAVDRYMQDFGNAQTLGHRRWLLATSLGPVGIGGTPGASCHWVSGGTGNVSRRFVAWPPAGPVPLAALDFTKVAETGWSVHAFNNADDLAGARVAVLDDGVDAPVDVTELQADYGSRWAVSFKPRGWAPKAGHEYVINVTAPAINANPIVYTVEVVGCP